jgi:hypothetical protein
LPIDLVVQHENKRPTVEGYGKRRRINSGSGGPSSKQGSFVVYWLDPLRVKHSRPQIDNKSEVKGAAENINASPAYMTDFLAWKCMDPVTDRHVRNPERTPELKGSTGWKMKLPFQTIENGPRVYSSRNAM